MAYIGTGNGNGYNLYNDFWEYDPSTNTWTQKANFGGSARDMLLVLVSEIKDISEPVIGLMWLLQRFLGI